MDSFRFNFTTDEWNGDDTTKVYMFCISDDYKGYYCTIKDGHLELHPKEENESAKEPLLTLTRTDRNQVLKAMVEGLARAGFVAEVDNTQKIISEAVSKERAEQIAYLRGFNERLVDKILPSEARKQNP